MEDTQEHFRYHFREGLSFSRVISSSLQNLTQVKIELTPHIANSRATKHPNQFARRTPIIRYRNDTSSSPHQLSCPSQLWSESNQGQMINLLTQRTPFIFSHLAEYIDKIIRRRPTRKDHDMTFAHFAACCIASSPSSQSDSLIIVASNLISAIIRELLVQELVEEAAPWLYGCR